MASLYTSCPRPRTSACAARARQGEIGKIWRVFANFELANPLPRQKACLAGTAGRGEESSLHEEGSEMFARFIAAVTVALALSAPAWAADRKDLQVVRDVQKQVLTYPQFSIFDTVHMQIDSGIVTLTGKVTMPYKKNDLAKRVARIDGVHQVVNRITVLPVSGFDDELRFRIARAIYGNSNFWNYGSMANPPIHVIVENGHVTLDGVVNSNTDRMLARSIASSFGAFSVTNDLKTDAEVEQELERL
jgi:hyperosmotically inducible protein